MLVACFEDLGMELHGLGHGGDLHLFDKLTEMRDGALLLHGSSLLGSVLSHYIYTTVLCKDVNFPHALRATFFARLLSLMSPV